MWKLCQMEGMENPKEVLERQKREVEYWRDRAKAAWVLPYYEHLLEIFDKGNFPKDAGDTLFFKCLNAVVQEKEDVWKRIFSAAELNDSKLFKEKYENRIITVLKELSPKVKEGMTAGEILAEHGIQTYSQSLEIKGALEYEIMACSGSVAGGGSVAGDGSVADGGSVAYDGRTGCEKNQEMDATASGFYRIDVSKMCYGAVLNAQTLVAAKPVSLAGVKRIMTIENKANYENMRYRSDTLYIYCHGFFAPKERRFLEQLPELADVDENLEYLHWGDMDYGGIRIYNFIKKELFPKLKPYRMDAEEYRKALKAKAGYPLDAEKKKKLQDMDAGDLEELRQMILEYDMEIEQEMLLSYIAIRQS
ncbi:MAG: DUF2399 domain-containing protein [Clostridia bacterium]|nr:DUF2399 domain-containing protein [Clostridia bacterium]NCC42550.1 DUF2399 domain-containing protein [Clostridia bacterium]